MNTQENVATIETMPVPEKYQILLENDRVRVLKYHSKPGEQSAMHSHPDCVVYSFSPATLLITTPYGISEEFELRAGELIWRGETSHALKNIGETEAHLLVIELKEPRARMMKGSRVEGGYFPLV